MASCRFVITHIGIEPNIRGQEMRRIRLRALDSEAFEAGPTPKGVTPADPDGQISILVNKAFAKGKNLGDEMALEVRP